MNKYRSAGEKPYEIKIKDYAPSLANASIDSPVWPFPRIQNKKNKIWIQVDSMNTPTAFVDMYVRAGLANTWLPVSFAPATISWRIATAWVTTQTISDTNVTASNVILITYEDASWFNISSQVTNRVPWVSFDVQFATIPNWFINYTII